MTPQEKYLSELGYSNEEIKLGKKYYKRTYKDNPLRPLFIDYMNDFSNWELAFEDYKASVKNFTNTIYNKTINNSHDNIVERLSQEGVDEAEIAMYIRKKSDAVLKALENFV